VLYYYHLSETNDVAVRKKPDAALPQSVTIPIKWALFRHKHVIFNVFPS